MSKLIDKLSQVSQSAPQSIGFRIAQPTSTKPQMVLIAGLAPADGTDLANYLTGADAGLLHIPDLKSGVEALQKVCQVVSDIPWGGWLKNNGKGQVEQILKAGCDFLVFPQGSRLLAIPQKNEVGKILEVEASLSEGLLRTIDDLPVDAVLVAGEQGENPSLTWHHLMRFRRFANAMTKPLLVYIPADVTANELQALLEAGVDGVVVEIEAGQAAGRLSELRQAIDKLSPRSPSKQRRPGALLPRITQDTDLLAEEEDEGQRL